MIAPNTSPARSFVSCVFLILISCVSIFVFIAVMFASVKQRVDGIHVTETYGAEQWSAQQTAWWRQP